MKTKYDLACLQTAQVWASLSSANRKKVGAVVWKDNSIIGIGYNGTPSGFPNICETIEGLTKPEVLHAESNALAKVACSTNSSIGATMYITCSPCVECAKLIIQCGIKRVVYLELYRDAAGIELLRKANVEVEHGEIQVGRHSIDSGDRIN
jgi:dCMP deaminase